jgi:7-carboxy-7-deazaguanine synthase
MFLSEIFYSVQGEGRLIGVPSAFIRTSGCNLRCWFCDSSYTSWEPEGTHHAIPEILSALKVFPTRHVVITGGEPLLAPEIEGLCRELAEKGFHITVETAATVFKPLVCDLASLSPKLASSTPHEREGGKFAEKHERLRLQKDVIQAFMDRSDYQLKFVIDTPADLPEVQAILSSLKGVDPTKVLLMPQGVTRRELDERSPWLIEACKQHGFRFCPRLHIELYGNKRGT